MKTENASTKQRLLDAAEILFAERGFEGVPIRDLAATAQVNVAAVNYHFQSKEKLYQAVLLRRLHPMRERMLAAIGRVVADKTKQPDLETLIRSFVSEYLKDALARPHGDVFLRLIVREMHEPRHGGNLFMQELVVPVHHAFATALSAARPDLGSDRIAWIIASIVGQVMHFIVRWRRGRQLEVAGVTGEIPRALFPPLSAPLDDYISRVVEHVTIFSLGGIDLMTSEA